MTVTSAQPPVSSWEGTGAHPAPQRPSLPARRRWQQGGAAAGMAAVLAGLAGWGAVALVVGVSVVQVLLVLGVLQVLRAPAAGGVLAIGLGAAAGADVIVLADDGRTAGLAGVAGLSLVAALLHQLARRRRTRVTESLADTLALVVLVCCAAALPSVLQLRHGEGLVVGLLVAAGCALLAGRVADSVLPRPPLVPGASRGVPGAALALLAGAAGCLLVDALLTDRLSVPAAALLGAGGAAAVLAADLVCALAAPAGRPRWLAAAAGLLLPFAVLGPVGLLAGRLLAA